MCVLGESEDSRVTSCAIMVKGSFYPSEKHQNHSRTFHSFRYPEPPSSPNGSVAGPVQQTRVGLRRIEPVKSLRLVRSRIKEATFTRLCPVIQVVLGRTKSHEKVASSNPEVMHFSVETRQVESCWTVRLRIKTHVRIPCESSVSRRW